jgi:hypothetical protein
MNTRRNKWTGILAAAGAELLLLGGVALAAPAIEGSQITTSKGQVRSELIHASASIIGIDKGERSVFLKSDDGTQRWVKVPESVKSFDKLKMGDRVDIDFYQSLAISMDPAGTKPTTSEKEVGAFDLGAGIEGRELKVSASVISVDPQANLVTFKGPKGKLRTIHVEDAAMQAKLPSLMPGRVVQFDYTEAVAADIRPAAK